MYFQLQNNLCNWSYLGKIKNAHNLHNKYARKYGVCTFIHLRELRTRALWFLKYTISAQNRHIHCIYTVAYSKWKPICESVQIKQQSMQKKTKIFPFWRPRMRRSNIFKCFMQKCLWKNCRVISFIAFLLYSTVDYFRTEEKSFSIKDTVQHWPMGRISLLCQTVN